MEDGFSFELYEMIFENCYINTSRYQNGNLQLSLFGIDPETNEICHFTDITLDQNRKMLSENEIVVDCKDKPTLIPQLKELDILKEQVGICVVGTTLYPIYTVDLDKITEEQYCVQVFAA